MNKTFFALLFSLGIACGLQANPIYEDWALAANHRTGSEMVRYLEGEIAKSEDIEVIKEARRLIKEVYDPIVRLEARKEVDTGSYIVVAACIAFYGYQFYRIVSDSWQFDVDIRDQRIKDLTEKIVSLQSTCPQVTLL